MKTAFNKTLKKSIVVDGKGRTLYLFTEDTAGKATCAAADPQCPKLWPALATVGKPLAGKGIKASLLGTTKGAGGVQQVTYSRQGTIASASISTSQRGSRRAATTSMLEAGRDLPKTSP